MKKHPSSILGALSLPIVSVLALLLPAISQAGKPAGSAATSPGVMYRASVTGAPNTFNLNAPNASLMGWRQDDDANLHG